MSTLLESAPTEPTLKRLPELEIVRAATMAPSPDNNQPWRFHFAGQRLIVYHDRRRALPSDVDGMFDLISLGAAIENACIAASHWGFQSRVAAPIAAPEITDGQAVAEIEFSPQIDHRADTLFGFLESRCTCRLGYSREPIPAHRLAQLKDAAASVAPAVQVDWISERRDIRRLAWLVAAADRVRFEHRPFHEELYRQLRFSVGEVEATRDGLDLRTLALPPGAAIALRVLRSWKRQRLLNRFGLSRFLSFPSAAQVWRSGAVGLLSVPRPAPNELLAAGRAFERLWLTCQAEGIALHPLGGLPIFLRRPGAERFAGKLHAIAPTTRDRIIAIMFRIGFAGSPAVRSLRRPASEVVVK